MAGSDSDSDPSVSTLAQKAPNDCGSQSTNLAAPKKINNMEVHQKNWHCVNAFRRPYVCGK